MNRAVGEGRGREKKDILKGKKGVNNSVIERLWGGSYCFVNLEPRRLWAQRVAGPWGIQAYCPIPLPPAFSPRPGGVQNSRAGVQGSRLCGPLRFLEKQCALRTLTGLCDLKEFFFFSGKMRSPFWETYYERGDIVCCCALAAVTGGCALIKCFIIPATSPSFFSTRRLCTHQPVRGDSLDVLHVQKNERSLVSWKPSK